ncbi:mRNA 3'-end-processing protein rna14, partial [Quaeritorhiza haematococci]
MEKLQLKIKRNSWDVDAWTAYLNEALARGDPTVVREAYEAFLKQFPTSARHWIAYAEYEQKQRAFERVESIFGRCLRNVVDIDLWKFYLNYIKRTHSPANVAPDKQQEARATVGKAYDFVLSNVGMDKDSSLVWSEYLNFIKSAE